MKRSQHLFITLPALSGVLLWTAWPPFATTWIIFIAFLPLLLAIEFYEQNYPNKNKFRYWLMIYVALLIWNVLTTWWVGKASVAGGLFANFANPALQSIAFLLFRRTRRALGRKAGYVALVVYWMSFEYLHLRWEFTWPWLTLGNVFAGQYSWVQWYELTGVFGGTLWIWLVNILLFEWLRPLLVSKVNIHSQKAFILKGVGICLLIVVPIVFSIVRYQNYSDKGKGVQVAVVQPNFNPYTEKFSLSSSQMLDKMLLMSKKGIDSSTNYLVWPETAVPQPIWINDIERSRPVRQIRALTDSFPELTTIIGINAFERYENESQFTVTTRMLINDRFKDTTWYDAFNTSIQIEAGIPIPWYHKSKLVPGVERMPYPKFFSFLEMLTLDLGGISGSLGTQHEREVFFNQDSIGVATSICYESVYGEYMSRFVQNGAELIFIITNDGWWGNTAGHKQHAMYASLRAIENRRSIARSANTGTSCFVNQRGDRLQATEWETDAVIQEVLYANDEITFYAQNGDFVARTSLWVAVLLLLFTFVRSRTDKNKSILK